MRIIKTENAGNGNERFVFHIGRDEAELMVGLIISASLYTPRSFIMQPTHARLNQMRREISKALKERQSHLPKTLRSVEGEYE